MMIKRNQFYLNIINILSEGLLILIAYLLSTYIRFGYMYGETSALRMVWNSKYLLVASLYSACIVISYWLCRMYTSRRSARFLADAFKVCLINLIAVALLMAVLYFTRVIDYSRIALALFYLFSTGLILTKRLLIRKMLRTIRQKGRNQKHVVVVGSGPLALQYKESVKRNPRFGFFIDGHVSNTKNEALGARLCSYEELEPWLDTHPVDLVVIALEPDECDYVGMAIEACEKQGVCCSIIPFFHRHFPAQPTIDIIGSCKLVNIRATPLDDMAKAAAKRLFDIIGSILLILITSPIMLVAAIGVKLSSPGPVIFKQKRVGRGKKIFTMYKFRTMRNNSAQDTGWSKNVDNRKTAFGSILRKTSIDEMPQFFNVLRGNMSLIGPRPEIPHYVNIFKDSISMYMLKHQIRPGITGWAQVNGCRGDTLIEERIRYDLWYIENWTFGLDVKILFKTILGGMINSEKIATVKAKKERGHTETK